MRKEVIQLYSRYGINVKSVMKKLAAFKISYRKGIID